MKYFSHLNSAVQIISTYDGRLPFHQYIKNFFRTEKKFGSKDRKNISGLCYAYFRIGNLFRQLSMPDRVVAAQFICGDTPNEFISSVKPEWNQLISQSHSEKIRIVSEGDANAVEIFSWMDELSFSIQEEEFAFSHLIQPLLFIRLRPGKENTVKVKLKNNGVDFVEISSSCLALKNSVAVDKMIALDEDAVVQDHSSQMTGIYMDELKMKIENPMPAIWDACSGSGGKSILCFDIFKRLNLDVSDIRPNILNNLNERFNAAGIEKFHSFEADLSLPNSKVNEKLYDLIIADVPCSGSGTWGRTPEQLRYFDTKQIESYRILQQNILKNLVRNLRPRAFLLYVTCSAFKKENEDQIEFAQNSLGMKLIRSEIIPGYKRKADTMFAAILTI